MKRNGCIMQPVDIGVVTVAFAGSMGEADVVIEVACRYDQRQIGIHVTVFKLPGHEVTAGNGLRNPVWNTHHSEGVREPVAVMVFQLVAEAVRSLLVDLYIPPVC